MTRKTSTVAFLLFACSTLLAASAEAAALHPDGPTATYRGFGPSQPTADGYICALFDSFGVRVGSVQFHADGRIDLKLGTEEAHYRALTPGITDFHDLDWSAFPEIPKEFKKADYRLMVFSGRFVVGDNTTEVMPFTELADDISVVEARCVYIVDGAGNVVFCLNCIFTLA